MRVPHRLLSPFPSNVVARGGTTLGSRQMRVKRTPQPFSFILWLMSMGCTALSFYFHTSPSELALFLKSHPRGTPASSYIIVGWAVSPIVYY